MEIRSEIDFFDRFTAEHGEYDVLGESAYRRLVGLFNESVGPRRGERCIDLGCGTGAFTRRLRGFGLLLTGMDISPLSVNQANQNAQGEEYIVGDIGATGISSDSENIIVYSGVLHHFPRAEDRARVLKEGFRILAPGGRLFSYDPSGHSPSMWLYRNPRSPLFSSAGKTENEVLFRREQLSGELHAAGFSAVRIRGVSGITFRFVESRAARLILPVYNLYEQLVRYSALENRIGTFLVSVAEKTGSCAA